MDKFSKNTTLFVADQFNKAKTLKSHTVEILAVYKAY